MAKEKSSKAKKLDAEMIGKIDALSTGVYKTILAKNRPQLTTPLRALSNVRYDDKIGYFEIGDEKKTRTLTVNTIKSFAQTLRMIALSKQLVKSDDIATKREVYYISKNWDEARFLEQPESDAVMDDIEAMFMSNRERLGFIPEEKGGDVAGKLIVVDEDPDTGDEVKIDCTKMGTGAYSVPSSVENLKFETKADFVLAIETAGMYQRLVKHTYWKKANCILISMGGVPTRACRRFIRRLSEDKNIPVYAFSVDGDENILLEENGFVKYLPIKELMENRPSIQIKHPFENERAFLSGASLTFDNRKVFMGGIKGIVRHPIYEPLYEIMTETGHSIKVTRSHSVIVYDSLNNQFIEKKPTEIDSENDFAMVSLDVPNKQHVIKLDLAKLTSFKGDIIITEDKILNNKNKKTLLRYLEGEKLKAFCRLLGYYCSEGSCEDYKLTFSFNATEKDYINDVSTIFSDLFNVEIKTYSQHSSEIQVVACNVLLSQIFESIAGKGAANKFVPQILYNVPNEAKLEFLKGYYFGDGRVDYKEVRSSVELWAKTVSKRLAYSLSALISQLGGYSTIQHPKEVETEHTVEIHTKSGVKLQKIMSKNKVYLISVANRHTLNILSQIVTSLNPAALNHLEKETKKASKFETLPKELIKHSRQDFRTFFSGHIEKILPPSVYQNPRISKKRIQTIMEKSVNEKDCFASLSNFVKNKSTLVRIKAINTVQPTDNYVYDIEMIDTHRFFANFICVHNTDGDPYGWLNIYRTLKVGSGNAAHINKYFCVPNAKFFGITAQDIIDYKLPTHPLKDIDIKRVQDGIKNDPFVQHHKPWQKALQQLVQMKKRAEQQALAKHGLNFVISDYLPKKLENPKTWLP